MNWVESITAAIKFMEEHLTEEVSVEEIASAANVSTFYFQKGFAILCDISVSEYLRNRRLSLAGRDLRINGCKVVDVAMKYCYESPDSFTKAFVRFHGITPLQAKLGEGELKEFLPLKLHVSMKGGFDMDCKIIKKDAFTVIGREKFIKGEDGDVECPKFWDEHYESGENKFICGMYGICIDDWTMMKAGSRKRTESMPTNETCLDRMDKISEGPGFFKYLIADDYNQSAEYPSRFVKETIPENTWAVFPCVGPMPEAMQSVYKKIFSEWLPGNADYDLAGKYNVENYSDASKFSKGTLDEKYYSEIWIPVKAREF